MDALKAILGRRSIRKYRDEPVTEDQIRILLEAAMAAPSGHNKQPWHFIVVRDREVLKEIPKFHPYSKMLETAGAAIIVCGDAATVASSPLWAQDLSAATENILLAATAQGLGSVWLGVYPGEGLMKGLRSLLGIPEDVMPFSILSLGVPGEEKPPSNRYNESRVHLGKW